MNVGRIQSDNGLDICADEFAERIKEHQVSHSTAFHALLDGQPYLVGPLARINLNHDRLPARILALLERHDITFPSRNMFDSIVARSEDICINGIATWLSCGDAEVKIPASGTPPSPNDRCNL